MSFLIAQILLLLALAAAFGGALVYWFMRRHFVDVSSEYARYGRLLAETRAVRLDKNAADARIAALEAEKTQLDERLADEMKWRKNLETRVEAILGAVSEIQPTDLGPVDSRMKALDESVRRLEVRLKPQPPTDLSGLNERLDGIEKALEDRPRPTPAPIAKTTAAPRAVAPRNAAPKPERKPAGALLESASYGKADDLKKISGVGPKLEKMLHDIGVYYYFQVGAWTPREVQHVDDLLEVFKGRIARDQWVMQARSLAKQPGAARMS